MYKELQRLQFKLSDDYFLLPLFDDSECIGWNLYFENICDVDSNTQPIMSSDTNTLKELKQYIKKHKIYTMSNYYNTITWTCDALLWLNLLLRIFWKQLNTEFNRGIFYGIFISWVITIIPYVILSKRNHKRKMLTMKEKHEYRIKQIIKDMPNE